MFALCSTLMVLVQVVQHFKGSCPEQIARTFWRAHCLPGMQLCELRKGKRMKKGIDFFSLSFKALWVKVVVMYLWIRAGSLGPSENSMSKEMMWHLMMDRAFSFSLSASPRLCRHILVGCNILEKEKWNKIEKPISPLVRVCQQHFPSFCMIPAVWIKWRILSVPGRIGEQVEVLKCLIVIEFACTLIFSEMLLALKWDHRGYNSDEAHELRVVLLWPVWLFINHYGHKGRIDLTYELM